jgi:hypothetical protein
MHKFILKLVIPISRVLNEKERIINISASVIWNRLITGWSSRPGISWTHGSKTEAPTYKTFSNSAIVPQSDRDAVRVVQSLFAGSRKRGHRQCRAGQAHRTCRCRGSRPAGDRCAPDRFRPGPPEYRRHRPFSRQRPAHQNLIGASPRSRQLHLRPGAAIGGATPRKARHRQSQTRI